MNYLLVIAANKAQQFSVRVSWHPSADEVPTNYAGGAGDFKQKIVEVNGSTFFGFRIAYNQGIPFSLVTDTWDKSTTASTNGKWTLSIVNPLINASAIGSTTVYAAIYVAAASNMRFLYWKERLTTTGNRRYVTTRSFTETGTYIPQASTPTSYFLSDMFANDFDTLVPEDAVVPRLKINGPDDIVSLRSMLHRFMATASLTLPQAGTWTEFNLWENLTAAGNPVNLPLYKFASWFMYRRGGFNLKFVLDIDTAADVQGSVIAILGSPGQSPTSYTATSALGRNGTILQDFSLNPSLEVNVPYMSLYNFVSNQPCISGETYMTTLWLQWRPRSATPKDLKLLVFFATADDFGMGWALGAPIIQITATPPVLEKAPRDNASVGSNPPTLLPEKDPPKTNGNSSPKRVLKDTF
jgi:hypothetical protein